MNYKEAEKRWEGQFGNNYTRRNKNTQDYQNRTEFWKRIIDKYTIRKVLEIGCNRGYNLWDIDIFIGWWNCYGIEINEEALQDAMLKGTQVINGSATDIPFKDNYFDLVFTAGLLIHIPPDGILQAMQEIVRCSQRYILCIEYWAEKEKERLFRGELGITWERPYDGLFLNNFNLRLLEQGFLTKKDGFNDLSYFMLEKAK